MIGFVGFFNPGGFCIGQCENQMTDNMDELASHTDSDSSDLPPGWLPLLPTPVIPSKREMTRAELTAQEQVIERAKQYFAAVGAALLDIRDRRGYRFEYPNFETYCRRRWDFGRFYAHRLIEAAEITANLLPMGNMSWKVVLSDPATWPEGVRLPENERQTRPLSRLEPNEQREAWKQAIETAPDGKITARHVESVVKTLSPPKARVDWSDYAVSCTDDETQILKWIMDLFNQGSGFDLDPTHSEGKVWKNLAFPMHKGDINPLSADVQEMDARHLKFKDGSLRSIYCDLPFVAKDPNRKDAHLGIVESRFGGFRSMPELWRAYEEVLAEFYRVLQPGGIVAFKTMDLMSGGKFHAGSVEIVNRARKIGFDLVYVFVLYHTGHGIMSPNMARQLNPRHNHAYYVILRKPK